MRNSTELLFFIISKMPIKNHNYIIKFLTDYRMST